MKFCKYVLLKMNVHYILMNEHAMFQSTRLRPKKRKQENGTNINWMLYWFPRLL